MATAILRPNGDVDSNWVVFGSATTRWDAINDAVTQPTDPGLGDYIGTGTANLSQNVELETISGVGTCTSITIWSNLYGNGDDYITVSLWTAGGTQIGTSSPAFQPPASTTWYSHTISGLSLTQTGIDGMRLRFTSSANGPMSTVYAMAAYVEITYTAPSSANTRHQAFIVGAD